MTAIVATYYSSGPNGTPVDRLVRYGLRSSKLLLCLTTAQTLKVIADGASAITGSRFSCNSPFPPLCVSLFVCMSLSLLSLLPPSLSLLSLSSLPLSPVSPVSLPPLPLSRLYIPEDQTALYILSVFCSSLPVPFRLHYGSSLHRAEMRLVLSHNYHASIWLKQTVNMTSYFDSRCTNKQHVTRPRHDVSHNDQPHAQRSSQQVTWHSKTLATMHCGYLELCIII